MGRSEQWLLVHGQGSALYWHNHSSLESFVRLLPMSTISMVFLHESERSDTPQYREPQP